MRTILIDKIPSKNIIEVSSSAQYVFDPKLLKGQDVVEVEFLFNTPGVTSEIIALYSCDELSPVKLRTSARHVARSTSCNTVVRAVLRDNSLSDYLGKIKIEKTAIDTSSFLDDAVLVVGKGTHTRSDPILEIEANEVKASHGSTTGRVDESMLYYLESRGLTRNEAEGLIVRGFFESVLGNIKEASVKNYLEPLLGIGEK